MLRIETGGDTQTGHINVVVVFSDRPRGLGQGRFRVRTGSPYAIAAANMDAMSSLTDTAAASARNVSKIYGSGDSEVRALDDVSCEFAKGQFTAIMGPSGSGKSTLMHCAAGLDDVTSGQVFIGDVDITTLKEKQLTLLRRDHVGFIFQSYNLVPTLNAEENITLPMLLAGRPGDK